MKEQDSIILPRTYWRYWADELSLQIIETQGAMALAGMAELAFVGPWNPKEVRPSETLRRLQDGMLYRLQRLLERAGDEALPAYQIGLHRAGEVTFERPNDPRWAVMVRGPFSWLPGVVAPAAAEPDQGAAGARSAGRRRDLYVPVTRKVSPENRKMRGSK